MKNGMEFHRTPLDNLVEKLSPEERFQILMDFDELERTGMTGDTVLRTKAGQFHRELQGVSSGFDALYMSLVANSVFKVSTIERIESAQEIGVGEARAAINFVREVASLETLDERHTNILVMSGTHASTVEQMQKILSVQKRNLIGNEVNRSSAETQDFIISEARAIAGIPSVTAEEQLERLPDLIMKEGIPKVMEWDMEEITSNDYDSITGMMWVRVNHDHQLMTPGFTDKEGVTHRAHALRNDEAAYQSFRRKYMAAFPEPADEVDDTPTP